MKKIRVAKVLEAMIFYCSVMMCLKMSNSSQINNTSRVVQVKVGLLLDLSQTTGKIGFSCINMSLSDFYASHSHYNTRILLHVRDSQTSVITAASQGSDLYFYYLLCYYAYFNSILHVRVVRYGC